MSLIDGVVTWFENVLGIVLIMTVVIDVLLQIVFRFFLNQPLSWSGELATFILIWLTFIGLAVAQREHSHVAMHILPEMQGVRRAALGWLRWLATAAFFLIMGFGGADMAITHSVERSSAMQLPVWVVYAVLPLGSILGMWHLIHDLPAMFRGEEVQEQWH